MPLAVNLAPRGFDGEAQRVAALVLIGERPEAKHDIRGGKTLGLQSAVDFLLTVERDSIAVDESHVRVEHLVAGLVHRAAEHIP